MSTVTHIKAYREHAGAASFKEVSFCGRRFEGGSSEILTSEGQIERYAEASCSECARKACEAGAIAIKELTDNMEQLRTAVARMERVIEILTPVGERQEETP